MTVLITLTVAGSNTGPFNLYSDVDGYVTPFATSISKATLQGGYTSTVVPDGTFNIKVLSFGVCGNSIIIPVQTVITTTTTSTSGTTTTTTSGGPTTSTTTTAFVSWDYYYASGYQCEDCALVFNSVIVRMPAGTFIDPTKYYRSVVPGDEVAYMITGSSPDIGIAPNLSPVTYNTCGLACAVE